MLMSCSLSNCQQSWEGPSAPHLCQSPACPWGSHQGQALTLCILFCLVEDMTPRRAVHALFSNHSRCYNSNSLPFKFAEKLMWSLLILHVLHACNTTLVFGYNCLQGCLLEHGLDDMEQGLCKQLYLCPSPTFFPSFQGMNGTKNC